jgi:molybdate transport system ATP-binding protein
LRALAGLVVPKSGRIKLGEKVLFDHDAGINLPPQSREIGYVPQNFALFPHLNVADNIAYGLHTFSRSERHERVQTLLELMRLQAYADRMPGRISGGQQQRAALARALAREPELLLMDEPFGALDELLRSHLRSELRRVQSHYNIPLILVTHNLTEAYTLADRLAIIDDGRVIQFGPRDEVFRAPRSVAVAQLMGMTNLLTAKVVDREGLELLVSWHGHELRLLNNAQLEPGSSVQLGVRPEDVRIARRPVEVMASEGENLLQGVLLEDRPLGFDHTLVFRILGAVGPSRTLEARIPHPAMMRLDLRFDQAYTLAIHPKSLHLFPGG